MLPAMPNQKYISSFPRATSSSSLIVSQLSGKEEHPGKDNNQKVSFSLSAFSKAFCRLSPLWTLLSAGVALQQKEFVARTIGSLSIMQTSLAILMLAMGSTITPMDISRAVMNPSIIALNNLLCFGMMPIVAILISTLLKLNAEYHAGMVLLGCVSGGQASNLFALLAGGDVALSVACTLSTTIMGILFIPLLVKWLLNCIVVVDSVGVLKSVAQLVLIPLLLGLGLGKNFQSSSSSSSSSILQSICPLIGVVATMLLVAGGASNCTYMSSGDCYTVLLASYLLPLLGAIVSWAVSSNILIMSRREEMKMAMAESTSRNRRTLVVEILSKSPTLAYVLAKRHFGDNAAAIPAAGMVSLAIVGAAVATVWTAVDPIENYQNIQEWKRS